MDLKAATKHGVAVFNAPYSNTRSVAELAIAEIIMMMRGIPEKTPLAIAAAGLNPPTTPTKSVAKTGYRWLRLNRHTAVCYC